MEDYEAQRLENLKQKHQLLVQLNLDSAPTGRKGRTSPSTKPPAKKRRLNLNTLRPSTPARTSARLAASSSSKPSYANDGENNNYIEPKLSRKRFKPPRIKRPSSDTAHQALKSTSTVRPLQPAQNIASMRAGWTSWTSTAAAPERDDDGTFHFRDYPSFTPNKSPEEVIREGSFGGSYWRPLHSQKLGIIVQDDWRELPGEWIEGLDVERYLNNPRYDASANKFGVVCGQSIEEWEAAGWINHEFDVRGWFQWYCRFFQGRRCEDDERQVSRWARCVGESGRWRKALLKKYIQFRVRDVFDDGEQDREVSPVMHQTCLHWAWELRQPELDAAWEGR